MPFLLNQIFDIGQFMVIQFGSESVMDAQPEAGIFRLSSDLLLNINEKMSMNI
jgi:hypothetical protein